MGEVTFKITEQIFSLKGSGAFNKELNKVSWNSRDPVYDLRGWDKDHTKMTKGITLTKDEFEKFVAKIKEEF